jgi:hypothetical protein
LVSVWKGEERYSAGRVGDKRKGFAPERIGRSVWLVAWVLWMDQDEERVYQLVFRNKEAKRRR